MLDIRTCSSHEKEPVLIPFSLQAGAKRMPSRFGLKILTAAICASTVSGCATDPRTGQPSFKETFASEDPCSNNARNAGIAVGAIAGLVIGNQFKHSDKSRLIGAALGAAVGGLIGHDMDARRCALAKIAKQYDLDMKISTVGANGSVLDDAALNANANGADIRKRAVGSVVEVRGQGVNGGHFELNSDQLTERAQQYFSAIADSYNARTMTADIQDPKKKAEYLAQIAARKILLIGHTDDTGNSRLNADLSERRARAVSAYMEKRGIPKNSLYFQGAGEAYPVADNATEAGRELNRRVEIVELADQASFDIYLTARKPRYDLYRSTPVAPATPVDMAARGTPAVAARKPAKTTKGNARVAANAPPAAATAGVAASVDTVASAPAITAPRASSTKGGKTAAGKADSDAGQAIDFGGVPFTTSVNLANVGQAMPKRPSFSLISTAYASEPLIMTDCRRDRPRASNAVKALADGKVYSTSEFMPGLYGKTWTDQVNGHQIVINKVSVLAVDGALANPPQFKVYTNYNPAKRSSGQAEMSVSPEVNTYLGENGLLYRMFMNGRAGLECVDIVFGKDGANAAKAGTLVYTRAEKTYAADFKPRIYQK
jgi:outer membrane protein OmpA-like peptidoglycan-associated protein